MQKTFEFELSKNINRVGHLDIPGGGQVVVDKGYVYIGHMKPPYGTSIIDVSDPTNPKRVGCVKLPDDYSHTHKVRVIGDLMYTNVEQNNRHHLRRGEKLPEIRERLSTSLGRAPNDQEVADDLGVKVSQLAELDAARERGYHEGGFRIYDISDKSNPRLLSDTKTFGFGVHRFDVDENYAYISTEMEGYIGNILVTYDISNPENPVEVSRWWMPGQHLAGGEKPTWAGYKNRLHHAMRVGNELWAACWHAGFRVLDATDMTAPKVLGSHDYHPPFPEPTHTVMPLPELIDGRRIAVGVDEEHDHTPGALHAFMWVFDVTDMDNIFKISAFDVSEQDCPWSRTAGGRFGAHQFREKIDGTLIYLTWFAGGLRVVDVADPSKPKEVAHFMPMPVGDNPSPQSNDCDVDENGLIYLLDRNNGLDILQMTL